MVLPVLKPLEPSTNWKDFGKALNESFDYCVVAYNTILTNLFLADVKAMAAAPDEIPKIKWPNTYQMACKATPGLPPGTISALDQLARNRYKGKNSDGIPYRVAGLRGLSGLPNSVHGRIMIVRNQEWHKHLVVTDEKIAISFPLLRRETRQLEWWTIELKRYDRHGRERYQVGVLRRLAAGELTGGDLVLYRKGQRKIVMAGITCYLPIKEVQSGRTATCKLGGRTIFSVTLEGRDKPWLYHADGFRRRARAHKQRLKRLSDDYKFEPRKDRSHARRGMGESARKQNERKANAIHVAAGWLINFCVRQGCSNLIYDETDCKLDIAIPPSELRIKVMDKAKIAGIAVTVLGGKDEKDTDKSEEEK
jgi:hypothetical protein